jgi:hypothetical protein
MFVRWIVCEHLDMATNTEPQVPPTLEQLMAEKAKAEAKRDAYLRRRLGPEGFWRWQQQALSDLAKLRPDGTARSRRTKAT